MKTTRKTNKLKFIIIGTIAAIFLIVGASTYYVYGLGGNLFGWNVHDNSETKDDGSTIPGPNTINESPSTDEQIKAGETIKDESIKKDEETSTTANNVDIAVTAYGISADALRISTIIRKVTNSGQCQVVLTNGEQMKTMTADVQALSSYSSCKGFTISNLSKGTWRVDLKYTDGSKIGTATTSIEL